MRGMIRFEMALAAAVVASALAFPVQARAESCTNDVDCKTGSDCGGQICDWFANPSMTCQPAGGHPKGQDGWCTTSTDCKCAGLGATCVASQCTFVLPSQAPGAAAAGGATGSAGGTSGGTGGSAAATGGTSGGTGGSAAATGGKSGTGGTTAAAGNSSSSSGGCALAGDGAPAFGGSGSVLLLLAGWVVTSVRPSLRRRARRSW
jgi:hypothetical protein